MIEFIIVFIALAMFDIQGIEMDFDLDAIDSRFSRYPLSFGYVVLA